MASFLPPADSSNCAGADSNRAGDATEHTTWRFNTYRASGEAAAATEHSMPRCDAASTERRVAQDGHAYTYEEFAKWYDHDAEHIWSSRMLSLSPQSTERTTCAGAATEHTTCAGAATEPTLPVALCDVATELIEVLLGAGEIEQLRAAERSLAPPRSLQLLARTALNAITKAGPNSTMDRNLAHWFAWRSYVACHENARGIIGSGITLAVAEFIDGTKDANQGGQPRLDFVFYRTDRTYCRLHPSDKKCNDANPIFLPSPAKDPATEQIPARSEWNSLRVGAYTFRDAAFVPQGDRIGKKEAYRSLQQTPLGPLRTEDAHFKWWLFICNLGKDTRGIIGGGIVAATLEDKWEYGVQLLLTRSDKTEARLQIVQHLDGKFSTGLLPPVA